MKPALFALVCLILGVAIGWVGTSSEFARDSLPMTPVLASRPKGAPVTGPRAVVVNGERHQFGTMDRFAKGSHTFVIRNDGSAPLEIALGHTTCKCTVGELSTSRLAPGESTDVKLDWQVKTGDTMFEQSAELITNDPQHNPIHLTIHGNVVDRVRPEETHITLNDLSTNETRIVQMRIWAYQATDLEVTDHRWIKPEYVDHLQVSFEPVPPDVRRPPGATSGLVVVLKILPGLPLGPISQTLQLTFNVSDRDPMELPLQGTVISDISLAGPGVTASRLVVNFGQLKVGQGMKRTVFITAKGPFRNDTQVQLTGTEPAVDFQASLGETIRDNPALVRFPLTIEIPPSAPPIARNGDESYARIKLSTTHPQVKELVVKVRYVVKE